MKTLNTTIVIVLLTMTKLSSQTTDEIPGPERVLVVYRSNHTYSEDIANYYAQKRNIPESNVFEVEIPDPTQYGCSWGPFGEEEIIGTTSRISGWLYIKQHIADHIEQYLNTTYYE